MSCSAPRALALLLGVALGAAGPAVAQESPEAGPEVVEAPTLGTASYDAGVQRDPFVPLTSQLETPDGPRFDSLTLTGVFLGTPGNSLVVLEDSSRRGHFLRVGESIGEARLIEIRPRSAVFEVTEYGTARRTVLELERTGE